MKLPAVFELMHERAHDSPTPVAGNRRVEIETAMRAICAGKIAANGAVKLFGAFLAKWRFDARSFLFALGAKIFSVVDAGRTNDAERRIEQ